MALIGVTEVEGEEVEVGVCPYVTNPDGESCEFARVVSDRWQHRSIGHRLMGAPIDTARDKSPVSFEAPGRGDSAVAAAARLLSCVRAQERRRAVAVTTATSAAIESQSRAVAISTRQVAVITL